MKKLGIFFIIGGLSITAIGNLSAQSRKEMIEQLSSKSDSLQKLLGARTDAMQEMEIKLARFQGAADANDAIFKRLENKTDSLSELLSIRNRKIKELNSEIEKLSTEVAQLREEHQETNNINEALQAELNTLKEPSIAPKRVKAVASKSAEVEEAPEETLSDHSSVRTSPAAQPAVKKVVKAPVKETESQPVSERVRILRSEQEEE